MKHFRTRAGLPQAKLAGRVGLHRVTLSEFESGRTTEALVHLTAATWPR